MCRISRGFRKRVMTIREVVSVTESLQVAVRFIFPSQSSENILNNNKQTPFP
jgi:hypothetical protein